MAKKDPFEKFRQATLGGETESPLKAALTQEPKTVQPVDTRVPVRPAAPAAPVQEPVAQPEKVINIKYPAFPVEISLTPLADMKRIPTTVTVTTVHTVASIPTRMIATVTFSILT